MERERLIDAIVAAPEDRGPWLVYADWLLERDEPRGELISLSLALEDGTSSTDLEDGASGTTLEDRIRLIESHGQSLLSPRLYACIHHWRFTFWRGFVRRAALMAHRDDPPSPESIEALFADPHAALPLEVAIVHAPEHGPLCETLLSTARPSLHRFDVLDLGPASSLLATGAPRLAWLRLRLSSIRTLPADANVNADADADASANDADDAELEPEEYLCDTGSLLFRPPPLLTQLELASTGVPFTPELVEQLAVCPALPQLRELQLGFATPDALLALCDRAGAFGHLETLTFGVVALRVEVPPLRALAEGSLPRTRFELRRYAPYGELAPDT